MNHQTYTRVSGLLYILVALLHLWAIANKFPVTIGEAVMPMWLGWVIIIVSIFMAYQGLKKRK